MQVGFIGVGKMGAPMTRCLVQSGHAVTVFDVDPSTASAVADANGCTASASADGAVDRAECVITMLPNGQIVRDAVLSVQDKIPPGAVLVDMSTSYPLETTALRQDLRDDVRFVDAPVSGGVWRAELGTLTIIAGGEGVDVDRVDPVLSAMGTVYRTGALGSGHAMKVLNN